ncbi:unnamed protein product [marine sediment metagenome]|uniref:DUF2490 domain-containing protein n=1 Tax=marine sediment metagenome TaxID=412755 RepID=X1BYT1_9ZZZZ
MGYDFVPFSTRSTGDIEFENRPWQQLLWQILGTQNATIVLRTRLEQRFRSLENSTALRLRQNIKLTLPKAIANKLTPILFDEMFFNLNHPEWVNKNDINQNRLFMGIQIPIKKNNFLQVGYLNQYEFRSPNNRMSHVFMLSLIIRT